MRGCREFRSLGGGSESDATDLTGKIKIVSAISDNCPLLIYRMHHKRMREQDEEVDRGRYAVSELFV
jgi:hypothetical protein